VTDLVFEPWIGAKYESGNRFGLRVLVLGESHYGDEPESHSGYTTAIVRKLGQKERHPFFTKVAKVLLETDKDIDNETRAEVWEHVAFYNYIQCLAGSSARIRPTPEMWDEAKVPFLSILDRLLPDVILVLGKSLSDHAPLTEIQDRVVVCGIKHPSTAFSYGKWIPCFTNAIDRAKNRPSRSGGLPS